MILKFQRPRRLLCHLVGAFLSLSFWLGALLITNHYFFHQRNTQREREDSFKTYKKKQQDVLQLKRNLTLYRQAQKAGLLAGHDRQSLQKILEELTKKGKLNALNFKISLTQRRVISSAKPTTTFAYRDTPISVIFDHSQDVDIFKFMEMLPTYLPGLVMPEQLSLLRSTADSNKKTTSVQGRYDFHLITWEENS